MTTLLDALSAIERGDPFAMRKAVETMGIALDALSEAAETTSPTLAADRTTAR